VLLLYAGPDDVATTTSSRATTLFVVIIGWRRLANRQQLMPEK